MNATEQAEAARRLEQALEAAGIVVSRGAFAAGNLKGWVTVDGASILGRLQAMTGWRVDVVDGVVTEVPHANQLTLLPKEGD